MTNPVEFERGFKGEPGKPYQPCNGTEFEFFYNSVCASCIKDDHDNCSIIAYSMAFSIGDEEYPKEWVYNKNGNATCTAYQDAEGESASAASYRCDKTEDLFRGESNEEN